MIPAGLSVPDLIGMLVGFVLTLLVFSYILGDNALFRLVIHIFVGVAAGYTAAVAWHNVILPQILLPLVTGNQSEKLFVLVPLLLGLLLLAKTSSRFGVVGGPVVAYMVGVGAATVVGGALLGTLFPQTIASVNALDLEAARPAGTPLLQLLNGLVIVAGTITTLVYFQFGSTLRGDSRSERNLVVGGVAWVGQIFIAIALGALFAGVYIASLTALVDRLDFLTRLVRMLF